MTKNRIKTVPITREEALEAIDRAATLQTQLRLLEAKRDKKIQALQDEYGVEIASIDDGISAAMRMANAYADANRDALFPGEKKSAETALATYGFRLGKPTLSLLKPWKWPDVLLAIKQSGFWKKCVRTTEEIDKEAVKKLATAENLNAIGLALTQKESFFVEPKVDGATPETSTPQTK